MASEYYKWLARDVQPEGPSRELTPAEKWRNWWDYHKWHVVITLACLWMVGDFVWDIVDAKQNIPDYRIAYVGSAELPADTITALEAAFASVGQDITENGRVQVEVVQYIRSDGSTSDPAQLQQAAQQEYAQAMQLSANIQTAESVLFLLEDPEAFQAEYGVLGDHHLWSACPKLTALELGNFVLTSLMVPVEGSNQEALAPLTFARRSFFNNETSPAIDGANALFDQLTEGAS